MLKTNFNIFFQYLFPRETHTKAYIELNPEVAIFGSFLLGFGDACFNTQIYALIGSVYKDNSAPAFAIFKFVQSGFVAISFFYSKHLELQWQLLLLAIFCISGTISFICMDITMKNSKSKI